MKLSGSTSSSKKFHSLITMNAFDKKDWTTTFDDDQVVFVHKKSKEKREKRDGKLICN